MSDKKVEVEIDTACRHDVKPDTKVTLKKAKEALKWTVKNDCPQDQDVLFCVYDFTTGDLVVPPFEPCTSDPPGLEIGRAFIVGSHDKAKLNCTARVKGQYKKQVLVGSEVPPGGCPLKLSLVANCLAPGVSRDKTGGKLTHRLDVEIIP